MKLSKLIEFSVEVPKCIEQWAKVATNCKGDAKCLDLAAKGLRECLDTAFPPSEKIEIESDKLNYILSSVFLLSNRLAKSIVALSELDTVVTMDLYQSEKNEKLSAKIDEIIAKFF